jgi:hypothetical protein
MSAAAAAGNSNVANVAVGDSMTGQVVTNANFAQASDIDANLDGNSINANQISNMDAVDNALTGSKQDGKTFFIQSIDQLINDTGNSNVDTQIVGGPIIGNAVLGISSIDSGLIAAGNTLTDSVSSQMISQSEMIEGNSNEAIQNVGVPSVSVSPFPEVAHSTFGGDSGLIAVGNTLTDSASSQMISQSEMIEGNSNEAIQNVGVPSVSISYVDVVFFSTFGGDSGLIAAGNTLTDSASSQIANQNDINTGNTNEVTQLANAIMAEDILTEGGALQKIDEDSLVLGNANTINHDGALTSTANTVTDGSVLQLADIFTSV